MTVVKKNSKQVLMEDESGYRFYISRELYDSGEQEKYLEESIPYSLDYSTTLLELVKENANEIEKELYRREIHTLADVLNNRKAVNDVVRKYINDGLLLKKIKGD